jgi:hypothetical protein
VCTQESALYGDLVLYLRDRAAELLVGDGGGVEVEQERLDSIVRDWFFTPQDGLYGCAPRDLIWAEQKGEPNPIHPDRLDEFFEDDCPVCQAMHQDVKAAVEAGEEHGWQWHHRDFILALARVVRPGARLWLQGWLDAVAHGAFARPGGQEVDDVF